MKVHAEPGDDVKAEQRKRHMTVQKDFKPEINAPISSKKDVGVVKAGQIWIEYCVCWQAMQIFYFLLMVA